MVSIEAKFTVKSVVVGNDIVNARVFHTIVIKVYFETNLVLKWNLLKTCKSPLVGTYKNYKRKSQEL